jgi:hypothetical protein
VSEGCRRYPLADTEQRAPKILNGHNLKFDSRRGRGIAGSCGRVTNVYVLSAQRRHLKKKQKNLHGKVTVTVGPTICRRKLRIIDVF